MLALTPMLPYSYAMPPTKATLPIEASPVRALRGDLVQQRFAVRVGISRMALLRFEQGCIPDPSPKFIPFLPDGLPWEAFVEDYHAYQVSKRQHNYGVLDTEYEFTSESFPLHPLQSWINASKSTNLTQVCVALCLHLPVMHKFLMGPNHPALPPEMFLTALADAGYDAKLITDFMLTYSEWKGRKHGKHS